MIRLTQKVHRRDFLITCSASAFGATSLGCGTLLHPERKGQTGGDIDWKIVALNGVGLVLFFIPGVVAFAVDYYNGTIFLPAGHYASSISEKPNQLVSVDVSREALDTNKIEQVVSDHVNQPVELVTGKYYTTPLKSMDTFWRNTNQFIRKYDSDSTPS